MPPAQQRSAVDEGLHGGLAEGVIAARNALEWRIARRNRVLFGVERHFGLHRAIRRASQHCKQERSIMLHEIVPERAGSFRYAW